MLDITFSKILFTEGMVSGAVGFLSFFLLAAKLAELVGQGIVQGGMLPKLENSFAAIDAGVKTVIITNANNIDITDAGTRLSR